MRATNLMYRNPKESTPDPYIHAVTFINDIFIDFE